MINKIKTGYFDWKEVKQAKGFIQKMKKQGLKVYHLQKDEDAYTLIAAKKKPTPKQIVGAKSGGYEYSGKPHKFNIQDARTSLAQVSVKDFEDIDKPKQKGLWWGDTSNVV